MDNVVSLPKDFVINSKIRHGTNDALQEWMRILSNMNNKIVQTLISDSISKLNTEANLVAFSHSDMGYSEDEEHTCIRLRSMIRSIHYPATVDDEFECYFGVIVENTPCVKLPQCVISLHQVHDLFQKYNSSVLNMRNGGIHGIMVWSLIESLCTDPTGGVFECEISARNIMYIAAIVTHENEPYRLAIMYNASPLYKDSVAMNGDVKKSSETESDQ